MLLGIIGHDFHDHAPEPPELAGDPGNAAFRVTRVRVHGAYPDRLLRADPSLTEAYVDAARALERAGADAITADCGLAVQHQRATAAAVGVPTALSTLLLAPALLAMLPPHARLAIILGDRASFGDDMHRWSGIDPRDERIVLFGMDGTRTMRSWNQREHTTDWSVVADELSSCGAKLSRKHPEVTHVLLECTGLPPAAPRLRRELDRPVWDWNTLCQLLATASPARSSRGDVRASVTPSAHERPTPSSR